MTDSDQKRRSMRTQSQAPVLAGSKTNALMLTDTRAGVLLLLGILNGGLVVQISKAVGKFLFFHNPGSQRLWEEIDCNI